MANRDSGPPGQTPDPAASGDGARERGSSQTRAPGIEELPCKLQTPPTPHQGQSPSSLVIEVVAFELGHVALEGGDVLA